VEAGALGARGEGDNVAVSKTEQRLWLGATAGILLGLSARPFAFRFQLDAVVPLLRPRFVVDGADASFRPSKDGASTALKEGDVCAAEKCKDQAYGCAATADGVVQVATDIRCVAGPQEGSGIGVCRLEATCKAASAVPAVLTEGSECPADKCANQQFACANSASGAPQKATEVRCVAGPQVGSGVGVCSLQGKCVAASP
jgi:hypothetical protein